MWLNFILGFCFPVIYDVSYIYLLNSKKYWGITQILNLVANFIIFNRKSINNWLHLIHSLADRVFQVSTTLRMRLMTRWTQTLRDWDSSSWRERDGETRRLWVSFLVLLYSLIVAHQGALLVTSVTGSSTPGWFLCRTLMNISSATENGESECGWRPVMWYFWVISARCRSYYIHCLGYRSKFVYLFYCLRVTRICKWLNLVCWCCQRERKKDKDRLKKRKENDLPGAIASQNKWVKSLSDGLSRGWSLSGMVSLSAMVSQGWSLSGMVSLSDGLSQGWSLSGMVSLSDGLT